MPLNEDAEQSIKEDNGVTFETLGLIPQLVQACEEMGYKKPSHIQRESIPWALKGRDIIGLAQTGSGKTAAFALPILQDLMKNPQSLFGLVLSPTRELALQISKQFEALGSVIGVKCAVIVGGVDTMSQAIALAKKPHIIVASPGKLLEHLENTKGFHLKNLKYLVLDEADRLLNSDFEEEINKILQLIPKERHTYLFSATMTSKVEKLQRASLSNPVRVEVSGKYQTVEKLIQHYLFVPAKYKDVYLTYILSEFSGNTIMVFTGQRRETQRVALMLRNLGFGAIPLHGQLTQTKRFGSLNKFSTGERKILIATDVASRGLDIPSVDLVINYDIPTHPKDYIHRVGRTARADRAGRAISIVTQYEVELYQKIEQLIGMKLERFPAVEEEVLVMLERVSEAQRHAALEMKEVGMDGKKRKQETPDDVPDDENDTKVKKRKAKPQKKKQKKT